MISNSPTHNLLQNLNSKSPNRDSEICSYDKKIGPISQISVKFLNFKNWSNNYKVAYSDLWRRFLNL